MSYFYTFDIDFYILFVAGNKNCLAQIPNWQLWESPIKLQVDGFEHLLIDFYLFTNEIYFETVIQ